LAERIHLGSLLCAFLCYGKSFDTSTVRSVTLRSQSWWWTWRIWRTPFSDELRSLQTWSSLSLLGGGNAPKDKIKTTFLPQREMQWKRLKFCSEQLSFCETDTAQYNISCFACHFPAVRN